MDETTVETWEKYGVHTMPGDSEPRAWLNTGTKDDWRHLVGPEDIIDRVIADHANAQQVTTLRDLLRRARFEGELPDELMEDVDAALEALNTGGNR